LGVTSDGDMTARSWAKKLENTFWWISRSNCVGWRRGEIIPTEWVEPDRMLGMSSGFGTETEKL